MRSSALFLAALRAAAADWALHLLDAAAYPRARCLDGSQPGFYIEPGTGASAANWIIHTQGGVRFCCAAPRRAAPRRARAAPRLTATRHTAPRRNRKATRCAALQRRVALHVAPYRALRDAQATYPTLPSFAPA